MDIKDLVEKIQKLPIDIRVEVLLCELFENKTLEEKLIQIEPQGLFERSHQQDLKGIDVLRDEFEEIEKIIFSVWREGIFDSLPKGIFYKPTKRQYKKGSEEIKEESLVQEREEKAGRDFFLPIEQEFYRQRLNVEKIEREAFSAFTHPKGKELFAKRFWDLDLQSIPKEQITSLLYFLPFAFMHKGNLKKIREVFQTVLKCKVQMRKHLGIKCHIEDSFVPSLGNAYLGINTVLGNSFMAGLPKLQFNIGPIMLEDIPKFLNKGPQAKLLHILNRFFVPADLEVETTLVLHQQNKVFYLDDKDCNGRLAYSTFL